MLVIEDDKFLRELYGEILTDAGFAVELAGDGEAGFTAMHTGGFDVVLLDIMLPKMDGLAIMKKLGTDSPPLKPNNSVIVLSNLGNDKSIAQAMELGAKGYMIKSDYTPDQVIEKVKSVLTT